MVPSPPFHTLPGAGLPVYSQDWVLGQWAGSHWLPISLLVLLPQMTGVRHRASLAQGSRWAHQAVPADSLSSHATLPWHLISRGLEYLNTYEDLSVQMLIHLHCWLGLPSLSASPSPVLQTQQWVGSTGRYLLWSLQLHEAESTSVFGALHSGSQGCWFVWAHDITKGQFLCLIASPPLSFIFL